MRILSFLILGLTLIFLVACEEAPESDQSSYSSRELKPELRFKTVFVTREKLDLLLLAMGSGWRNHKDAITMWDPKNRKETCTIYIEPPKSENDSVWMRLYYHEVKHCQLGQWHA